MDCSDWRREGSGRSNQSYMMGENKEERTRLSLVVPSDRTRGSGHKIQAHKVISENMIFFFLFFFLRVVKYTGVEQVAQRL